MKFFMSAGEASGDLHAAQLIRALKAADPAASFSFLGGDEMAAQAGCQPIVHYREMAFMAFSEVIRNAGKIARNLRIAKEAIRNQRPDAIILIDYPGFNFKLMKYAHSLGIPVYYYIAPKVWAWKEWRVKSMRRYLRKVLSILPFEVSYFNSRGVDVTYVGNPSMEEILLRASRLGSRPDFIARHNLPDGKPILALVPGSRRGEIRNNLPVMVQVAEQFPQFLPVIAAAPAIDPDFYASFSSLPIVKDATFELINHSDAALVTSGTATLETAILGTPQVVCYRANGSRLSYSIMRRLIKVDFVALPNLIADEEIVPEMLLHRCTPDLVARQLAKLLPGQQGRQRQLDGYARMRSLLQGDAAVNAARTIIADLSMPQS